MFENYPLARSVLEARYTLIDCMPVNIKRNCLQLLHILVSYIDLR